jgi:hypothetical protein
MSRKPISLLVLLSLAALTACADVTGPESTGFCTVNGGPGTCGPGATAQK